jgi:hypothetical protein
MSNEETKFKHSRRIFSKQVAVKRQEKIAKSHGIVEKQPHRFFKHHALNCHTPQCIMCGNPRKIWKEDTIQEKRFKQIPIDMELDDDIYALPT